MGSSTLVSLEEYLHTTYRPDCDYVDGEALERNIGEQSHNLIQAYLTRIFGNHRDAWQLRVITEQRVQVRPNRFRIPDVCVVIGATRGTRSFGPLHYCALRFFRVTILCRSSV